MGRWRLPKVGCLVILNDKNRLLLRNFIRSICVQAEMEQLATTVRKVARLLWALHLSFLDGFDEVWSRVVASASVFPTNTA